MVHGTMHSLTDATASWQLATILKGTDAIISLGRQLKYSMTFPATASGTGRLGVLLPARINYCMMASCQEQLGRLLAAHQHQNLVQAAS